MTDALISVFINSGNGLGDPLRREQVLIFENNVYDNLFTDFDFAIIDPLGVVVSYDLVGVYIEDDQYYHGLFYIPLLDVAHGEYTIQRYDPTVSLDYTATGETIATHTIEQIGGWAAVGLNGGGGNSGTRELRYDVDSFFEDIGENCFAIVENYITLDFENPRRDINRVVRGQNDYIFIQVESLTRGFNKVGWQCRNPDYCPVVEVARM